MNDGTIRLGDRVQYLDIGLYNITATFILHKRGEEPCGGRVCVEGVCGGVCVGACGGCGGVWRVCVCVEGMTLPLCPLDPGLGQTE